MEWSYDVDSGGVCIPGTSHCQDVDDIKRKRGKEERIKREGE